MAHPADDRRGAGKAECRVVVDQVQEGVWLDCLAYRSKRLNLQPTISTEPLDHDSVLEWLVRGENDVSIQCASVYYTTLRNEGGGYKRTTTNNEDHRDRYCKATRNVQGLSMVCDARL